MKHKLSHEIDNYPESDDAGTLRVTAKIFGQDDNSTFTTLSLAKDFLDDENEECKSKEDLNYFLLEAGITEDVIYNAILELIVYVDEVTCPESIEYSPGCALKVQLDLVPDHLDDDDDDSEIQEAAQVSFDDTSNIRFRPASKLVVKSLPRKVYKKKNENKKMVSLEECRICLQEFSNGGMVVTLSCGHEFDDECIVKCHETQIIPRIDNYPEPDDVGIIRVTARLFGQDDNSTFTVLSLARDFIANDECKSKEDLNYFLLEAGINEDVISDAIIVYVDEVTCPASIEYSPGCALKVRLDLIPDYLDDDDDTEIQEAAQVSFDETSSIWFRPASKLVVKSLTRKIYNKKIKKEKKKMVSLEECRICLQDFNNGGMVVTLSCGHEFDDECIVKWFETSHVCPLCRLELPCQDEL
ncbi:hypothetical protein YC2023_070533 [Brassica napus]